MKIHKKTGKPIAFSGNDYHKNSQIWPDGSNPCAICGKAVEDDKAKWFIIVDCNNDFFITPEEAKKDINSGCWPVGAGCAKKYHKELKDYLVKG